MKSLTLSVILGLILLSFPVQAQYITKYPEIPRIDVHSHIGNNYPSIGAYLAFHDQMLAERKIDLAMWINLGKKGETAIDTITDVSKGRIMTCINDKFKVRINIIIYL